MDATAMNFEAAGKVALRTLVIAILLGTTDGNAQEKGFRWVKSMPEDSHPRLEHGTYYSDAMALDVGYVVYLPQLVIKGDLGDHRTRTGEECPAA